MQHFLQPLPLKMSWTKQFTTSSLTSSDRKLLDSHCLTMSLTTAIGTSAQWAQDSTTTVGTMPMSGLPNKTQIKSILTDLHSYHGGTTDSKLWHLVNTRRFLTTSRQVSQQLVTCSLLSQSRTSSRCSFGNLLRATLLTTPLGVVTTNSPTVSLTFWQTISPLTNMICLNQST